MKKWKNPWKRVSRSVKLILNLVWIACFLWIVLLYLDYPYLTAASAFRHAFEYRSETIALELEMDWGSSGAHKLIIGSSETNACVSKLEHQKNWRGWSAGKLSEYRAIEDGLWCVPLDQIVEVYREVDRWTLEDYLYVYSPWKESLNGSMICPCFAVKAPSLTSLSAADMTLVLDPFEYESFSMPGGAYPLQMKAEGNGWVVFGIDAAELFERHGTEKSQWERTYEYSDANSSLLYWMWDPLVCTGRVELTVSNQTFTWELDAIRQTLCSGQSN